jgi:hypothetical protein
MNNPILASASAEFLPVDAQAGAPPVEQKNPKLLSQIETDAERIRSSVTRLASDSMEALETLVCELQQLQSFLKSEVERVQGEIESAVAGIGIITETIASWKTSTVSATPSSRARTIRADWLTRRVGP